MSEKNKCVGLDCEMCGNTKCPNEEKEPITNGIDVSECENKDLMLFDKEHYCKEIEYDDGSPAYTCEERPGCYFKQLKRLQEENEELKYSLKTQCVTCKRELENCRILFIADKYKQALEEIRDMLKESMSLKSNAYNHFINVEKAIDKIKEVLNECQRNRNCN